VWRREEEEKAWRQDPGVQKPSQGRREGKRFRILAPGMKVIPVTRFLVYPGPEEELKKEKRKKKVLESAERRPDVRPFRRSQAVAEGGGLFAEVLLEWPLERCTV
jgi:hypothetical protein